MGLCPVVDGLHIYTRSGCPYCYRLLGALRRQGVQAELHDIWSDDESRAFVRAHNDGNETVPTVELDGEVWTNPSPRHLLATIGERRPDLLPEPGTRGRWGHRS